MVRDTFTHRRTRWLDFLVEVNCDNELARLQALEYDLQLTIRDGHKKAALAMFKHLGATAPVQVIVENDMVYIPHFDEMMNQLSNRGCLVQISFKHQWKNCHQWKNPQHGFSDNCLNSLLSARDDSQRCCVTTFTAT